MALLGWFNIHGFWFRHVPRIRPIAPLGEISTIGWNFLGLLFKYLSKKVPEGAGAGSDPGWVLLLAPTGNFLLIAGALGLVVGFLR